MTSAALWVLLVPVVKNHAHSAHTVLPGNKNTHSNAVNPTKNKNKQYIYIIYT